VCLSGRGTELYVTLASTIMASKVLIVTNIPLRSGQHGPLPAHLITPAPQTLIKTLHLLSVPLCQPRPGHSYLVFLLPGLLLSHFIDQLSLTIQVPHALACLATGLSWTSCPALPTLSSSLTRSPVVHNTHPLSKMPY
jgi:hypothetical protein